MRKLKPNTKVSLWRGVAITVSILSLLYTVSLHRSNSELEKELSVVKHELDRTNRLLDNSQKALKLYIDPIEYDVAAPQIYDIPLSEDLQQHTYDMCVYYGIEQYYATVLAIMWQESDYNADLISSTDDHGIMQINECNFEDLQTKLGIVDFLDPYQSIESGVYILSTLDVKYDDIDKVLMAYNMGPTGASRLWKQGIYTSSYSRGVTEKTTQIINGEYGAN